MYETGRHHVDKISQTWKDNYYNLFSFIWKNFKNQVKVKDRLLGTTNVRGAQVAFAEKH
jgi:hypothetical protein